MRKSLLAICFLSTFLTAYAQVNLTATMGSGSGSYVSLKAAFDKINDGTHRGAIAILVGTSAGQTITETAQAVVNRSGSGLASYTSITISPAYANITLKGSFAGACCEPTGIIQLNNADNITIDGRIGQSGSIADLTIENTNAGSWATAVYFRGASNNAMRYCIVKSASTGTSSGVGTISMIQSTYGCANNIIEYCTITKSGANMPQMGLASLGWSTRKNQNNTVRYCTFSDFKRAGIWLGSSSSIAYNESWTISDNIFYESASFAIDGSRYDNYAIYVGYHATGTVTSSYNESGVINIINNQIGGNGAGGNWTVTGSSTQSIICGIYLAASSTSFSNISGNVIRNFDVQTQNFYGICIYGSKVQVGNNGANTVTGITLNHSSATTGGVVAGIYTYTTTNLFNEYVGNEINSITAETGPANFSSFYGMYAYAGSSLFSDIVNRNRVTNISATLAGNCFGIYGSGAMTQNHVSNIKNAGSGAELTGIYFFGVPAASRPNYRVENNEVILGLDKDGNSTATNKTIYGITINGIGYSYYNSVLIRGTHSGATNTYCLRMSTNAGTGFNNANDLLYNARNGGTGTHYCIMTSGTNAITSTCDAYIFEGSNSKLGLWNSITVCNTLSDWVAVSAETNSISESMTNKPVASLFPYLASSNTLQSGGDSWLCAGTVVATTNDFLNVIRHNPAPTTIGAYELDCTTLPVELLWFRGAWDEHDHSRILLDWATLSETNNDFFVVEHSSDGTNFEEVFIEKGAGQSNQLIEYHGEDPDPAAGINYYRLRQVDYDGVQRISGTIYVLPRDKSGQTIVFPTVFESCFYISYQNTPSDLSQIILADQYGRIIPIMLDRSAENLYRITPRESLSQGMYLLRIGEKEYIKLIKTN